MRRLELILKWLARRKPLALLAILAAAGPHGVSRDRLLLLLWPDSDTERARRALKTMVHALRRQLDPEVVEGVAELRLGSTVVTSDIERFRAAVAFGDDAAAVAADSGRFLDGVYVRVRALAGLDQGDSVEALMDGVASLPPAPALVAGTTGL